MNKEILIITAPGEGEKGSKGLFGGLHAPAKLNIETLKDNLKAFLDSLAPVLTSIPSRLAPYKLEEIEITVEINAEGNIQLVGGLKVGASGGLTFRLKKEAPPEN